MGTLPSASDPDAMGTMPSPGETTGVPTAPSAIPTAPSAIPTAPSASPTAPSAAPTSTAPEVTGTVPEPSPSVVAPAPSGSLEDVPSYGEIYYMINLTCANVVCHVPGYFMPDLSDANNDQYEILMNTHIEQCGGAPLVKPGDPDGSAIIMVTHQQCVELAMPKDCTDPVCIAPEKVEALRAWIAAGAPRD
jgi:hypothetical protein